MKLAGTAVKFSIALGSVCVIMYSIRVGHFPRGLALGDGLLFLLTAGCFGSIYVIFTCCLVSLGCCLSPLTQVVFRTVEWTMERLKKQKSPRSHELRPFSWTALPFGALALFLISSLAKADAMVWVQLILLSIGLHLFYSVALSFYTKFRDAEKRRNSLIETSDSNPNGDDSNRYKKGYLVTASLLALSPLLIGGVSGELLDRAMRIAQVRVEKPTLYIKVPYNALLPESLVAKEGKSLTGYKTFEGPIVLFKGFGNSTVIAFKEGVQFRKLEIPNNKIIVEQKIIKRS